MRSVASQLGERDVEVREAVGVHPPERIIAAIGSVTSQTLTFLPACTHPSRSQNATNSRAPRSPRITTSS